MPKRVSVKGKGADLFFGDYQAPPSPPPAEEAEDRAPEPPLPAEPNDRPSLAVGTHPVAIGDGTAAPEPASRPRPRQTPSAPAPATSSRANGQASKRASKLASNLGAADAEEIDAIRQVVKAPGREVSFVRLSPEEKGRLSDVVYTYKRQGIKTTENEVSRIAINALLADYRANGEQSTLAKVLAALQA